MDRKEDSSHGITITPSSADFSPVTFRNSYQKSTGSNSDRQTCSLAAVESGNSIFATTPKSTVCKFSGIESVNVLPGPSSQDENVHEVTTAGPSKRLIWKRERLDDSIRKMYEAVLEARKKWIIIGPKAYGIVLNICYNIFNLKLNTKVLKK